MIGDLIACAGGGLFGGVGTVYLIAPAIERWQVRRHAAANPPRHAAGQPPNGKECYAQPELAGWQRVKLAQLDRKFGKRPWCAPAAQLITDLLRRDCDRLNDLELAGVLLHLYDAAEAIRDGIFVSDDLDSFERSPGETFHAALGAAALDLTSLYRTLA